MKNCFVIYEPLSRWPNGQLTGLTSLSLLKLRIMIEFKFYRITISFKMSGKRKSHSLSQRVAEVVVVLLFFLLHERGGVSGFTTVVVVNALKPQ